MTAYHVCRSRGQIEIGTGRGRGYATMSRRRYDDGEDVLRTLRYS